LKDNYTCGTILMSEKSVTLGEVIVVSDRIKAKAEAGRTTYFINQKMYDASETGAEMLTYIPGIQTDLMKNISLNGSNNIVIEVDGKERDKNFLSQLNPNQIDKVEVITSPDSKYEAGVTGVINVILKKSKEAGISGHIHTEIPTSESVIYLNPAYSLNYNINKFNFYTSYNGNLSYFDIVESSNRHFVNDQGSTDILTNQIIRQKYWSHEFHYGLDYLINEKNKLSFYGYYNPYSSEHNGNVEMSITGDGTGDKYWSALKKDNDINRSAFYSIYYSHIFNKPGREISFDLNYAGFNAVNSTTYTSTLSIPDNYPATQVNTVKPNQNSVNLKVDYSSPISDKIKFDAGIKARIQTLRDRLSQGFKYDESIFALYGQMSYSYSKINVSAGLRIEESTSGLTNSFTYRLNSLLPNASFSYKLTPKQNIKLSYKKSVYRPNIYDLNPFTAVNDPFSVESGNPNLKPEPQQIVTLDFSNSFGDNYGAVELLFARRSNAINHYMFLNDTNAFETRVGNMGKVQGFGIQFSGAIKLTKAISINPYLKLLTLQTISNDLAKQYDITNRQIFAFESGLSTIITFKYDITASMRFQYNSPNIEFQGKSFSDALYFMAVEKTFNKKFKIGIKSALTFTKSFTYHGNEFIGKNFYNHSEGNIKLNALPVWLTFSYDFKSGKSSDRTNNSNEDIYNMPKKGF
jgi:outer membrane receptor protein involved in Fe transport